MSDKISDIEEYLDKRDLNIILEVNKKAIEIQMEVADQNEEIIGQLGKISENQETLIEQNKEIIKQNDENGKELFKMQVLYITGLLAIVAQIIQIFVKK